MAQLTGCKLPSGYVAVRDILDGKFAVGSRVSVVGLVTDFRAPIPTRGTDWKCQMRFYDQSVEDDDNESLLVNIFRPESDMPDASCGDVVAILAAKVQRFRSEYFSLCTHLATVIHVYETSKIPKPPRDATSALRPSNAKEAPSRAQGEFVSVLHDSINKTRLPSDSRFESMKEMSVNVNKKLCALQDVWDGRFADVIAQIVRDPYDLVDKICLWISDYTENPSFFHFSYTGNDGQTGDPYGYGANFSDGTKNEWAGPFGKRSMQVTCFDPHASVIRSSGLSNGSWILLRNLQIKLGRNGSNLEGYLREDRSAQGPKINVTRLDPTQDPEGISPLFKDAIRRKRDYERSKKDQLKEITEAALAGQKRRADMGPDSEPKKRKKNKNKRKKKRQNSDALQGAQEGEPEGTLVSVPDMNTQVKCENENKPLSLIADILEPVHHETTVDGEAVKLQLPFVNAKYRSNVRVVDFMPSHLEDFSRPRKVSEYDSLSDHESESESEAEATTSAATTAWEWRFYLELEDAVVRPGQQKKRFWVLVDNQAAQCLMDLDASDLRRNHEDLEALRSRLFILWGELEEHKARAEKLAAESTHNRPPDDSDDDKRRAAKTTRTSANRPFSCCIRQYGVKMAEPDRRKADAGDGRRWQRMFGLFGTRVATM
ncbi:ssDNA-binding domain of telomere protection protein [Hirsutella rhossiliensis]|uniref:Protection of telomeres protein 1 n=1 Tax=Hirsutella rhossiliensis TaxID=111463 RepID=A0A9P8SJK2_9HYPO|nr:ssDNA-binding domain of telomere protection protein [Hirsutella rhossiliensis]KAH0964996.1 ssDNA-binding domain of telomere protection protein [Hirsutella rhossiliensis]